MGARYNWIAVRTAFVVKRWSYQKCADEFKLDVTTIKKRGSKERWVEQRDLAVTDGKAIVAQDLLAEARATTEAATSAATEAACAFFRSHSGAAVAKKGMKP